MLKATQNHNNPLQITQVRAGSLNGPRISGDGQTLVWTERLENSTEVMLRSKTRTQQLTDDFHSVRDVRVNQDGSVVTWTHNKGGPGKTGDLDIMRWNGGDPKRIASSENDETQAYPSADGKQVFLHNNGVAENRWNRIQKWDVKEGIQDLTDGTKVSTMPLSSADGSRVVFLKREPSVRFINDLWLIDQNGVEKPVRENRNRKWNLDFSSDGNLVSWVERDADGQHLYRRDLNGGSLQKLRTAESISSFDMSGDGKSFLLCERGTDGSQNLLLGTDQGWQSIEGEAEGRKMQPTISDDGRSFAWLQSHEGQQTIYLGERL